MTKKYPFLDLAAVNAPLLDEIQQRVARVVTSGRYVGGDEVRELEDRLTALTGQKYAVGVSNGLDALRLILRGYIITGAMRPGDEIIVPANTYVASVLAISDAGLVPVLAEPSALTSNLDLDRLEEYLTERTKGIMPVHLYGRVCWSDSFEEFARHHNLKTIEDNAQGIGASVMTKAGRKFTGGLGDAAAFSFYPTKNVGAMGDAGAVTTSDEELAEAVRALANYGSDRRYHNIYRGFNCRLDPIQAAVLNVKLPHMEEENHRRREIAMTYSRLITNPAVRTPMLPEDPAESVWHQYVIHVADRDRLLKHLDDNGVGWDIHYATPPHLQPCYRGVLEGSFPITERLADECVSLPIGLPTTPADAAEIVAIINTCQ